MTANPMDRLYCPKCRKTQPTYRSQHGSWNRWSCRECSTLLSEPVIADPSNVLTADDFQAVTDAIQNEAAAKLNRRTYGQPVDDPHQLAGTLTVRSTDLIQTVDSRTSYPLLHAEASDLGIKQWPLAIVVKDYPQDSGQMFVSFEKIMHAGELMARRYMSCDGSGMMLTVYND